MTTSASGLDPDITLQNAEYQLDRVSLTWATDLKRPQANLKAEIEQRRWTMPVQDWSQALNQLAIKFAGRVPV